MSAMSRFTQKAFYRAGFVAGAMLLMPSILLAQDTGSEAQSQPPLSADDETPIMYREIVVTARRRDERLQDVPVSVSDFSAEALASSTIQTVDDINTITPGFRAGAQGRRKSPRLN